jgi:hypothetical protein
MSLIELLVGIATAVILVGTCAKILQLGIVTYGFAARQTASLTRTRKAVAGDGQSVGILEASREAYVFSNLLASTVTLTAPSSVATSYYVSSGNLYRNRGGVGAVQSDGINSIALNYYMATGGMISSTTLVSSATLVTATVTVGTGTSVANKTYALYMGASLRNHQ